jgi:hypothetical protein
MVDLSGYRGRTIDGLHKKYGPVVQLAPNEVSFSSIETIKRIYGPGTTCMKSPAYDTFGKLGLFQMRNPEMHRERYRRVSDSPIFFFSEQPSTHKSQIAHIFAPGSLQQMEPLVQGAMKDLVEALTKREGTAVDALHWVRMAAVDISGKEFWRHP